MKSPAQSAFERIPLTAAVGLSLATALCGFHPVYEVDAFFQMQLARAVLEHGSRLVPEPSAIAAFSEPCLAFEWLWGVLLLGLLKLVGPEGLTGLTVLLAAAAVWAVYGLLRTRLAAYPVALSLLLGLSSVAIASRVKARPQVLFMVLLPGVIWLAQRLVACAPPWSGSERDAGAARRRWMVQGAALLLGVTLWAQLHASFVLVPGIYFALALQRHLDEGFERARLRADALVLLGLLLALTTSAAGLSLVPYLLAHGGGDAAAHVTEMAPTDFALLSPFDNSEQAALFLVWGLALAGCVRGGRVQVGPILLALCGLVLLSRAQRFVAAATLLALPLASAGAENLCSLWGPAARTRLRAPVLCAGLSLCLWGLAGSARMQARSRGPLLHAGFTAGAHPIAALKVLDPGPGRAGNKGRREILTDYRAGPALSFWSEGRVRHYVDGRTPQYFDDADYAVQRELFGSETALLRGLARYQPSAAVVRREGACAAFVRHWDLVAIDPLYSTFMPRARAASEPPTLVGVTACGEQYVTGEACAEAPDVVEMSLRAIARAAEPAFVAYLRAARVLRCQGDPAPALALHDDAASWGHRIALRRLQAQAAVMAGDAPLARARIEAALDEGDVGVVQLMQPGFERVVGAAFARDALTQALSVMDDGAPPALRVQLAALCASEGDLECARFQGLRAAARGELHVIPVLRLLSIKHPREQVRRDAEAWLRVLQGNAGG